MINSADNLTITGLIDENNLAQLLAKEVDKISDIAVKITPDNVEATGKISFLGQEATINVKRYYCSGREKFTFPHYRC